MINKDKFYDAIRASKIFGTELTKTEVENTEFILDACIKANFPKSWIAYCLATAYHETDTTMQPIAERGGYNYFEQNYGIKGKNPNRARLMGNTAVGDGALYCGRGYVQITWKINYQKASKVVGKDLVKNPNLAMQPDIAALIMISGMKEGWFTAKSLKDYLPSQGLATQAQFIAARKIINGVDKASKIAQYAIIFQGALAE